jgi:DNA-binding Lrp family transcriptional regulator
LAVSSPGTNLIAPKGRPGALARQKESPAADELNIRLIELLLDNPEMTYKRMGQLLKTDQRTIAKRVRALLEAGVVSRAVEVDWSKLGFRVRAYVGSRTTLGEGKVSRLVDFLKADPRILEAYETIGANEYFMLVVGEDLPGLRDSVLRDLEPITAELNSSVVTSQIKQRDQLSLLRYLRDTRFPRSRTK